MLNPKIKENDREKYEEAKLKYGLNVYGDGEADKNIGEIDPVDSRIWKLKFYKISENC